MDEVQVKADELRKAIIDIDKLATEIGIELFILANTKSSTLIHGNMCPACAYDFIGNLINTDQIKHLCQSSQETKH